MTWRQVARGHRPAGTMSDDEDFSDGIGASDEDRDMSDSDGDGAEAPQAGASSAHALSFLCAVGKSYTRVTADALQPTSVQTSGMLRVAQGLRLAPAAPSSQRLWPSCLRQAATHRSVCCHAACVSARTRLTCQRSLASAPRLARLPPSRQPPSPRVGPVPPRCPSCLAAARSPSAWRMSTRSG
jgi:hypothetical protein